MIDLKEFLVRLENKQPLLEDIGRALVEDIRLNFFAESAPNDEPWLPLRSATIQRKITRGLRPEVLQSTGALLASIDFALEADRVQAGPTASLPYERIHQFGGSSGPGGRTATPRRAYVGVSEPGLENIRRIYTGHWFGTPSI